MELLKKGIDNYRNGQYESSILSCGKAVESGLKTLYLNLCDHYKDAKDIEKLSQLKAQFEYLHGNQRYFDLNRITLGSLMKRSKSAGLLERLSNINQREYYYIYNIDWHKLLKLRNEAAHKNKVFTKGEAEEVLTFTKIFLLETNLYGNYTPEGHILAPGQLDEIKYEAFCSGIWCDMVITKKEKKKLEKMRIALGISHQKSKDIQLRVIPKRIVELLDILDGILMDGVVYDYERNYYFKKANELGVKPKIAEKLFSAYSPKTSSPKKAAIKAKNIKGEETPRARYASPFFNTQTNTTMLYGLLGNPAVFLIWNLRIRT